MRVLDFSSKTSELLRKIVGIYKSETFKGPNAPYQEVVSTLLVSFSFNGAKSAERIADRVCFA
jgi:hypothetical protein